MSSFLIGSGIAMWVVFLVGLVVICYRYWRDCRIQGLRRKYGTSWPIKLRGEAYAWRVHAAECKRIDGYARPQWILTIGDSEKKVVLPSITDGGRRLVHPGMIYVQGDYGDAFLHQMDYEALFREDKEGDGSAGWNVIFENGMRLFRETWKRA